MVFVSSTLHIRTVGAPNITGSNHVLYRHSNWANSGVDNILSIHVFSFFLILSSFLFLLPIRCPACMVYENTIICCALTIPHPQCSQMHNSLLLFNGTFLTLLCVLIQLAVMWYGNPVRDLLLFILCVVLVNTVLGGEIIHNLWHFQS